MEPLIGIIKEYWLKYKSIPFVMVFFTVIHVLYMANRDKYEYVVPKSVEAIILVVLFAAYTFACFFFNRLPYAKKESPAVLFVIDAETPNAYESAKYKLVHLFEELVRENHGVSFQALCIPKQRVKRKNLAEEKQIIRILEETNCIFLVQVRYLVDDTNNAENYKMIINCAVIHPRFNDEAEKILFKDLKSLNDPVRTQKFSRADLIDVFDFTAQSLSYICQYTLGLVCLLANNTIVARGILLMLAGNLDVEKKNISTINHLKYLVRNRLFVTELKFASDCTQEFEKDKQVEHLQNAKQALEEANKLFPDTYDYNLLTAYW